MEEAPENGKELSHSARADGINEFNMDVTAQIRHIGLFHIITC